MRAKRFSLLLAALLATTAPLRAADATQGGADAMLKQFSQVFGPLLLDQGILSVAPQGSEYAVTFDLEKAFGLLNIPGAKLKMDRFTYFYEPLGDGAWRGHMGEYPAFSFTVPTPQGDFSGKFDLRGHNSETLYTPDLPEILRIASKIDAVEAHMQVPDAKGGGAIIDVLQAGGKIDARATNAGQGQVNFTMNQTIQRLAEIMTITPPVAKDAVPAAPIKINYNFGVITSDAAIGALRARSLFALWTWLLAHTEAQKSATEKAELKDLMIAALPLWDKFGGSVTLNDMVLDMPQGNFVIKALTESLTLSGLTPKGEGRIAFHFDGINAKSPLLPPWSASLLPASFDLDLKVAVDGLDQVARIIVDEQNFEPKASLSKAAEAKIAAIFMSGSPKVTLAPGHLTLPLIDIAYEGETALTLPVPSGQFTVTADSLDKTLAFLQKNAASMPAMAQAIPGLLFVKGLGKANADGRLSWAVAYNGKNAITVNGLDIPLGK